MEAKQVRDLMEAYASVYEGYGKKKGKKKIMHDCATHGEHAEWGVGSMIKEMHTLDEEGNITHYDVMFEHGIEKNVPVEDLTILEGEMHEHFVNDEKNAEVLGERSTDLFDYLLEYLVAEGYADTNKAALAIMANMSEEWRQSIIEAVGLVGPPQKPQDVIPGVRALRTAASNIVKASDYPMNVKPQKVGTQVVPYGMIQKGSPSDTYADISKKPATASKKEPVKGEKINLRNL